MLYLIDAMKWKSSIFCYLTVQKWKFALFNKHPQYWTQNILSQMVYLEILLTFSSVTRLGNGVWIISDKVRRGMSRFKNTQLIFWWRHSMVPKQTQLFKCLGRKNIDREKKTSFFLLNIKFSLYFRDRIL